MAKPKTNGTLPIGSERIMALVERSQPCPDRPRVSDEFEVQLQVVHARSAAQYASMEDLSDRIERLAQTIDDDESVIVDTLADGDSIVVHARAVSAEIAASHHRLAGAAPTPHAGTPAITDDANETAPIRTVREQASSH